MKYIFHPIFAVWTWIPQDGPFPIAENLKTVDYSRFPILVEDDYEEFLNMYCPLYLQTEVVLNNTNVAFSVTLTKRKYKEYLDLCTYITFGILNTLLPTEKFRNLTSDSLNFLSKTGFGIDNVGNIITIQSDKNSFKQKPISGSRPFMNLWKADEEQVFNFIFIAKIRKIIVFHNNENLGIFDAGPIRKQSYLTIISDSPSIAATLNYYVMSSTSLFNSCLSTVIHNTLDPNDIEILPIPTRIKIRMEEENKQINQAKFSFARDWGI